MGKGIVLTVVKVNAIGGAYPKVAIFVLHQGIYLAAGQAVLVVNIVLIDGKFIPVVFV